MSLSSHLYWVMNGLARRKDKNSFYHCIHYFFLCVSAAILWDITCVLRSFKIIRGAGACVLQLQRKIHTKYFFSFPIMYYHAWIYYMCTHIFVYFLYLFTNWMNTGNFSEFNLTRFSISSTTFPHELKSFCVSIDLFCPFRFEGMLVINRFKWMEGNA